MLTSDSEIGEFDVVKLKDGREVTILEIFLAAGQPLSFLGEISDTRMELIDITHAQIEKVIWKASQS